MLAVLAPLLFADGPGQPVPTWTDKEVLIAVGSALGAAAPVLLFVARWALSATRKVAKLKAERQQLREDRDKLRAELDSLQQGGPPQADLAEMQRQLQEARDEVAELLAAHAETQSLAAGHRRLAEQLRANLDSLQRSLGQYQGDLAAERRRVRRALRKDGQTWSERVLSTAPDFRALDPEGRRTPVISVLNLKGGVGKTTVTANLGAALRGLGYKVLLLDLDLQGSLTGLFLSEAEQERLYQEGKLLDDFLTASFEAEFPNILKYTHPLPPDGRSGLVPTTDTLAYAETNLTIRWLLREGNRDPRFLLRRELQLKRVTGRYDIVLLDCPPLINVCCVNALAASDYLIVPVLPSRQATDRVPILLRRLKEFRENINSDLKIMGVLANRTFRSRLTDDEANRLTLLDGQCKDIWGEAVPRFEAVISQSREVREAEDESQPLPPESEAHRAFVALAREVESRLPTYCRAAGLSGGVTQEAAS
jgi:cellulose biosynthesis protein BcsQ